LVGTGLCSARRKEQSPTPTRT